MNTVSTNIIIRTGLKFEALTLHTHKQYAALYNEYFFINNTSILSYGHDTLSEFNCWRKWYITILKFATTFVHRSLKCLQKWLLRKVTLTKKLLAVNLDGLTKQVT